MHNFKTYLLFERAEIFDFSQIKDRRGLARKMETLERKYFSSYLADDQDGIMDDFDNKGFLGSFAINDNEVLGYTYGYAISSDELDDLTELDIDSVKFLDREFRDIMAGDVYNVKKIFNSSNTFYVSNFVVETGSRFHVNKMLVDLLKKIRGNGYEYIMFDGLEDTITLTLKSQRFNRFGITPLATAETDYSLLFLVKLT